jgi:hypothetical protein
LGVKCILLGVAMLYDPVEIVLGLALWTAVCRGWIQRAIKFDGIFELNRELRERSIEEAEFIVCPPQHLVYLNR